jgi:branched-chain amino acid transport system ATP-binding protein
MNPVLTTVGLSRRFGGIVVADDIAFSMEPGEVVGLIGPNGAGKTTFFNLLTGFVTPDAGQIVFDGQRIEQFSPNRRAGLGLARTWQSPRLFASLSILDNLLIADREYPGGSLMQTLLHPAKVKAAGKDAACRAECLLERVGMTQRADQLATRLSYGQQKLIGLARALMNGGKCLLLDEPMAGVSGALYDKMQQMIREEADRGMAVCVVEHNIGFIRDLCNRAAFMINGCIVATGSVDALMADRRLTALYFGAGL